MSHPVATVRAWASHPPARCFAAPSAAGVPQGGPGAAANARRGEPSRRPPDRPCAAPGSGRRRGPWREPGPRRFRSRRWTPRRRPYGQAGWTNWTGSWVAGCTGAVVLLAGEPGVGKSTLLLEVARSPPSQARCSMSPARNRRRRYGCARTASGGRAPSLPRGRDPAVRIAGACGSRPAAAADRRFGAVHHRTRRRGNPGGVTQIREVTSA